jgi:hypothetical protein
VAGDEGQTTRRKVALNDLQVGAADRAGAHRHEHLAGARHRDGQLPAHEALLLAHRPRLGQHHRDHAGTPAACIMVAMDWIRDNLKMIGLVVVAAMAMPFLLVLMGIIRF